MTRDEADNTADWATLDGGEAFALIERHANDFDDANELMQAWARTRVRVEREACAKVCEEIEDEYRERESLRYAELRTDAQTGASDCAYRIRTRGDA